MNSFNGKTITVSVEFRRKLLKKVKSHPIIWQNSKIKNVDSVERHDAWKTIEREMGYPCSLKEIQATWATLSEMYFRLIFLRTIERNFEPPVWQFFHEMTFLYDHVKETIQNQLGGISPPLFKPRTNGKGSPIPQCPCCVYVGPDINSEPDMISVEVKHEDELANIITSNSETSFENYQNTNANSIGFVDSESVQSTCSLDAEGSNNKSCFLQKGCEEISPTIENRNIQIASVESLNSLNPIDTHSCNLKQIETHAVLDANTQPILQNSTIEVIELMDYNERNTESPNSQFSPESLENMSDYHSTEEFYSVESHSIGLAISVVPEKPQLLAVIARDMTSSTVNKSLADGVSLTQPIIGSNDQILSLEPTDISSKGFLVLNDNCNGKEIKKLVASVSKIRAIKRSQIIEAVKANPGTYLFNCRKRRKLFIEAWNRVAEQLGNVPYQALMNRWKLIKHRYLKELVLERYSTGIQKSSWECFDKLEFLRPYMQEEIDEIHRTRDQMKNTIEKKALESTAECVKDKTQFNIHEQTFVAYGSGNQNIQIKSVETINSMNPNKTEYHKKPKQLEIPVVLDGKTLPILQNRPVKITAVKFYPSTHENDKNKPNDNAETPPPANKLRKITVSDTHVLANKTPKRLPSTQVSSLALDLATVKPATTAKLNYLEQAKPQKVFPTLDLTLDEDLPTTVPTSTLKKIETTGLQRHSVDECIYTCKVFPPLDLTTDENNDDDKNGTGIPTISTNEDNVIFLDDD